MDKFRPPKPPSGFESRVAALREAVKRAASGRRRRKLPFEPVWGDYKDRLSKATRRKCGYCEMFVTVGQDGDVEHFYPKSEIWALLEDAADRGMELDWTAKVRGRKKDIVSDRAFWWLAYDWANYLLSCAVCNQKWKLAYFPAKEARPTLPPSERTRYTPLLLNPFKGSNPRKHLEFGPDGEVVAHRNSKLGQATIDVCGLDRESLRFARMEKAKRAHALVSQLLEADEDSEEFDRLAQEIYEAGNEDYAHCGLVKTVFEQKSLMTWAALKRIVDDIQAA